MRRTLISAVFAFGLLTGGVAGPLAAAPCKDARGKFIKCPPPPPAKPAQCKDAKGKFIKCPPPAAQRCKTAKGAFAKCGTPGARPV